jgi:hypothetical protein
VNNIITTLIVAFGVVVGPLLLAYLTGRQRRTEKIEDYKRQDAVAAQAAEAARLLLASNRQAAAVAQMTNTKLDVIHTLVNSTLTAAIEAQLDATVQQLAMMRQVVALAGNGEMGPSDESLAAVESKIAELRVSLSDRMEQTRVAEAQMTSSRLKE